MLQNLREKAIENDIDIPYAFTDVDSETNMPSIFKAYPTNVDQWTRKFDNYLKRQASKRNSLDNSKKEIMKKLSRKNLKPRAKDFCQQTELTLIKFFDENLFEELGLILPPEAVVFNADAAANDPPKIGLKQRFDINVEDRKTNLTFRANLVNDHILIREEDKHDNSWKKESVNNISKSDVGNESKQQNREPFSKKLVNAVQQTVNTHLHKRVAMTQYPEKVCQLRVLYKAEFDFNVSVISF